MKRDMEQEHQEEEEGFLQEDAASDAPSVYPAN